MENKNNIISCSNMSYEDLQQDELELLLYYNINKKNLSTNINEIKYFDEKIKYIKSLIK